MLFDEDFVSTITRTVLLGELLIAACKSGEIRRLCEFDSACTDRTPDENPGRKADSNNAVMRSERTLLVTLLLFAPTFPNGESVRGRMSERRNPSVRGALTVFIILFKVFILRILNPARRPSVNKRAGN